MNTITKWLEARLERIPLLAGGVCLELSRG
jgi:hypothetical protein